MIDILQSIKTLDTLKHTWAGPTVCERVKKAKEALGRSKNTGGSNRLYNFFAICERKIYSTNID